MKTTLPSAFKTQTFGLSLAQRLTGGAILALHGDLGTGKTTLTQGIAKGLKIEQPITSPTFTIANTYPIKHKAATQLVHIDTYRLNTAEDLLDIGITDLLSDSNSIVIIEWPEKIQHLLPLHTKHFYLKQKDSILTIESSDL